MKPLDLLIYSLCVYRLSLMISKENGPFWMFRKLRGMVSRKAPKKTHLDEGVKCEWCASIWIASLLSAYAFCRQQLGATAAAITDAIILAFALSAVAVILNQAFTKG